MKADDSESPLPDRIVQNKPSDVVDGVWAPDAPSIDLANQETDLARVLDWYPVSSAPRIVAAQGDLNAAFINHPQLRPLDRASYPVQFTDEQWTRLDATFPDGVADRTNPDPALTPAIPWLSFDDGPDGKPITPAPPSTQF